MLQLERPPLRWSMGLPSEFPSPKDLAKPNLDIPAVSDYIQRIQDNIAFARDRHAEAKTRQTTYANQKRQAEPDYKVGDKVYLETKDLRLRFNVGICRSLLQNIVGIQGFVIDE